MSATVNRLDDFSTNDEFIARHIGPDETARDEMLRVLNSSSMTQLLARIVPKDILDTQALPLPAACSEQQALKELSEIAKRNQLMRSLIGQGYYNSVTPAVIQRNILENPAWYTAYTPYQPEISQGRLEALLNFQTAITDLTGMELANASMLDEATAAAEAMTLCRRQTRVKSNRFFVDQDCLF